MEKDKATGVANNSEENIHKTENNDFVIENHDTTKSTLVAYFLLLTLGWSGMHHFYLNRNYQGISDEVFASWKRYFLYIYISI